MHTRGRCGLAIPEAAAIPRQPLDDLLWLPLATLCALVLVAWLLVLLP